MVNGDHCCYSVQIKRITFPETCPLPLLGSPFQCLAPLSTQDGALTVIRTPTSLPCPLHSYTPTITCPSISGPKPFPNAVVLNQELIYLPEGTGQCLEIFLVIHLGEVGPAMLLSVLTTQPASNVNRAEAEKPWSIRAPCPTPTAWAPSSHCNGSPFREKGPQSFFLNCKLGHSLPCSNPTMALVCQARS